MSNLKNKDKLKKILQYMNSLGLTKLERSNLRHHNILVLDNKPFHYPGINEKINILLSENFKQIIGFKIEKNFLVIASNCKFVRNYNKNNFKNYFGFYIGSQCPPSIKDANDMKILNKKFIVEKTPTSVIYMFIYL